MSGSFPVGPAHSKSNRTIRNTQVRSEVSMFSSRRTVSSRGIACDFQKRPKLADRFLFTHRHKMVYCAHKFCGVEVILIVRRRAVDDLHGFADRRRAQNCEHRDRLGQHPHRVLPCDTCPFLLCKGKSDLKTQAPSNSPTDFTGRNVAKSSPLSRITKSPQTASCISWRLLQSYLFSGNLETTTRTPCTQSIGWRRLRSADSINSLPRRESARSARRESSSFHVIQY